MLSVGRVGVTSNQNVSNILNSLAANQNAQQSSKSQTSGLASQIRLQLLTQQQILNQSGGLPNGNKGASIFNKLKTAINTITSTRAALGAVQCTVSNTYEPVGPTLDYSA